jgi:hypothetical protein
LEFKTFRSPERKQNENENSNSSDDSDRKSVDDAHTSTIKGTSHVAQLHRRQPQLKQKPSKKATSKNASISSKKSSNVTFSPVPMSRMNGDKVSIRDSFFRHVWFSFNL